MLHTLPRPVRRPSPLVVVVLAATLVGPPAVGAQSLNTATALQPTGSVTVQDGGQNVASLRADWLNGAQAPTIRTWLGTERFDVAPAISGYPVTKVTSASASAAAQRGYRGRRGRGDRGLAGLVLGALGGALAGGAVGVAVAENSCNCDNPALHGFVIGAPIGAFVGGLIGYAISR